MNKDYQVTSYLRLDTKIVSDIIEKNQHKFFCPFSNTNSYLNIYFGRDCSVQFLNLQHCDYSKPPQDKSYIRYLMKVEKSLKNDKNYNFLKDNFEKFCIETNEENFILPDKDAVISQMVKDLEKMWAFDPLQKLKGRICRTRIVRLPKGSSMPYHRDETVSKNIRVICPIITHKNIKNNFRDVKKGVRSYHFASKGYFYIFDESSVEHAVFNDSPIDRYALIFTVMNIDDFKLWDRKYYETQISSKISNNETC